MATRTGKEQTMEILTMMIGIAVLAALKPTEDQERKLFVPSRLKRSRR